MHLLCLGDIGPVNGKISKMEWAAPGGFALNPDSRILFNWELPVFETTVSTPRGTGPRLVSHPDSPSIIRNWSPGFATLATNHIIDGGENGLFNTIQKLRQSGFTTIGAGQTREEITRPLFWDTGEGCLAMVNWVFAETNPDWMAVPGPNCWPGLEEGKKQIQSLKKQADWVMVVVHWSDEYFPYPLPMDRMIAKELVHAGADLIIGHHPHVVRGMEIIEGSPVFYSLGNFFFSNIASSSGKWVVRWAPRNREGLGVQLTFRRGQKPGYQVLSFWQTGSQSKADRLRRAARRMEETSRPLRRLQDEEYSSWYKVQRARFDRWDYRWHFGLWQLCRKDLIGYPLRLLRSQENRLHPQ